MRGRNNLGSLELLQMRTCMSSWQSKPASVDTHFKNISINMFGPCDALRQSRGEVSSHTIWNGRLNIRLMEHLVLKIADNIFFGQNLEEVKDCPVETC